MFNVDALGGMYKHLWILVIAACAWSCSRAQDSQREQKTKVTISALSNTIRAVNVGTESTRQYFVSAFKAEIDRLSNAPNITDAWPVAAAVADFNGSPHLDLYWVEDGFTVSGVSIEQDGANLGCFRLFTFSNHDKEFMRPTALRLELVAVTFNDSRDHQEGIVETDHISLPHNAMSGRLKLRLLKTDGKTSEPIAIWLDPDVVALAATQPRN